MLKMNHGDRRRLAGLFVAGAIVVAGVAVAAPSNSTKAVKEIKEVKITRTLDGNSTEGAAETIENCPGKKIQVSSDSAPSKDRKESSAIVLCGEPGASDKEMAEMIDKAIGRIQTDKDIRQEAKQSIIAKLRGKADELRAH